MKKVILFVAVVSAFSFASCKKDRVCTCTVTSTYGGMTSTSTDITTYTQSKKSAAMSHCLSRSESGSNNGIGAWTRTWTCSLN